MAFWLVAVPNGSPDPLLCHDVADYSARGLCHVRKLQLPSKKMRVGSLDTLLSLCDELSKLDSTVEQAVKKCERAVYDLLDQNNTEPGLYVENSRSASNLFRCLFLFVLHR